MKPVRLQKYLAQAGVGSRRSCEVLIRQGRVTVNGSRAQLGMSVRPGQDRVELRGRAIDPPAERVVVALNKPVGFVSTCRTGKETGRPVTELVDLDCRLYPAGRLDRDSEGLLILTNDGDLAMRLMHPRYGKEKEYEVELDKPFDRSFVARLEAGVRLDDGPARAARVRRAGLRSLRIVLTEGRKRQLRRMCEAMGFRVVGLRRIRLGGLRLGNLKPGKWRQLSEEEIRSLVGD